MPTFEAALRTDSKRLRAVRRLVKILNMQAAGIPSRFVQAAENLKAERYFPTKGWREVADAIAKLLPTFRPPYKVYHFSSLETTLAPLFRKHQLSGPLRKANRKIFGRVLARRTFESIISSHGVPPTHAIKAVDDLLSGALAAPIYLKSVPLGRHFIWSTFCEHADDADPFNPRAADDAAFVDSLGLFPDRGDFYLGFSYHSPAPNVVRYPTIADAYGGSFFYGFRPGGRTRPVKFADSSGRPEAVHPLLKGDSLSAPIEIFGPL